MDSTRNEQGPFRKSPKRTAPKVLIIDSDIDFANILGTYLEGKRGFSVLVSDNGIDGIAKAIEHAPDLILLDFRLSDITGLEVHERLRREPITSSIPVVYVSAYSTLRLVEKAASIGAKGFISKPFSLHDISNKVINYLRAPSPRGDPSSPRATIQSHAVLSLFP